MNSRARYFRSGLTLCVMLAVAIAGLAGTVQAQAPQALPSGTGLEFVYPGEAQPIDAGKPPVARGAPQNAMPSAKMFSPEFPSEVEPNGTSATATPLPLNANNYVQMQGNIFPAAEVDFYSFTGQAGDRVYAAVMTSFNGGTNSDSQLTLFASDGTTQVEFDDDDGSFAGTSSSIAGATLPAAGTYYLKVNQFNANNFLFPYYLHVRLQRGAPVPEVEPNDTPGTANPLPASGWVSGARSPAAATEQDWYTFTANAGDTVFLSLDADPERDNVQWNGRLGIALFGDATNQILVVDDASTGSATNPLSEALFFTIKTSGTYFAFVDSASAATGGPTATYNLSVTVAPPPTPEPNCTTYTSTDVPKTIGPGTGLVSSTITVPGNPLISDVDVSIQLNHALMQDVDAHLRSPAGNDIQIFTDIGAAATGGQQQMDVTFNDEAAIAPTFTVLKNMQLKPKSTSRLFWLDGENAGGTWSLDLYDDTAGANGGNLTGWSLRICEAPPPPACPPGFGATTVYTTDFESGAAGFTHSGTADEWELGLPATLATATANPVAAFTTCASGVNCWKTDLDNTYNISSVQDLLSPSINLAGLSAPVVVNWSHRYQMESTSFDHYNVDFRQVGGATPVRVFERFGPTMTDSVGNPAVLIPASAGWARVSARADSLAGLNSELNFHVDSDNTVNFAGVAIDDVSVTACRALSADLSITKTDGVTTAVPGGSVTYTVTASNAGPDAVTGATVADTFPGILDNTCTWTCVGAGGGTCTASGSGNINDATNLPTGGSVTYTASCAVNPYATGSLDNTATVSSSLADPNPGNNSATDTDTLTPQADLSITKTDDTTVAIAGGIATYTITASNAGPSNSPGVTVTDTFPADLTCTWTCIGFGAGTCTASGSGNISDTVNLPAGGSARFIAACNVSGTATGPISNTATVAAPAGVPDPVPGNNSATDVDTVIHPAQVSGTKTVAGTFLPGGAITYTVTLSNSGDISAADNAGDEFVDVLPAGLALVSASSVIGTATTAGNTVRWNGPVPSNGNLTITINATIGANPPSTISNQGSISYDSNADGVNDASALTDDPGTATPLDPTVFTVTPTADLSITKTDGVATVLPGGFTTYTITAANAGPSAATGATVTDTFPASLACSWTCTGAGGGTCTASGNGNLADTANLPAGGSATYSALCSVLPTAAGSLVNTATVAAPAGTTDPTPGNNSATDTDTVIDPSQLTGFKTVTGTFQPNGSVTYSIVLSNGGGPQADNPGNEFADLLPASLTLVSASATSGTAIANVGTNTVTWNGALASGASVTITINATINANATGTISNQGSFAYDADGNGTNESNGLTDDPGTAAANDPTTFTLAIADLEITKSDGTNSIVAGTSTVYAIVATNRGPVAVTGATVTDTFPAECNAPTWTCSPTGGAACPASGSGNIAASVDLPNGASATFVAVCPTSRALPADTVITNTATIAAPAGTTDPNAANDSATDTTTVTAPPPASVTGTKTVAGTFTAGGTVTYTIVLANSGPGIQTDNAGDELADTLPAQLTLVSATASSGTAVADIGTNTVTWNGAIFSGATVTITITATINAGASGIVSNLGLIRFDNEGDGINHAAVTTDDPAVGGPFDSTDFTIGGAPTVQTVPVPGLTPFGLAVLALGMLFAGMRRRRHG